MRAFQHSRQPPVSGAPAGLQHFGVDSFSVVPDVHTDPAAFVPDLGLDPAGLRVPERIPQQFAGDSVDLVLEQRVQILRLPFHSHSEDRWILPSLLRGRELLAGCG